MTEMKYEEFFELVQKMRNAQKAYFKARGWKALNKAKDFEQKVDEFLVLNAPKKEDDRQQDLFSGGA